MKKILSILTALCFVSSLIAQTQVPIGPQSSTFSSMIRGYHFTAPTNFNLCALYIPQDASTGTQNIAVVQFNPSAPPAFPGTTNAFTILFSATNVAANSTVAVNIPMTAGTIYGIYGARSANCVNSYDGVNFVTNISGFPTTLSRSGMQACLAATPMANIWSEVNYSIGRIFMYYNCCPTPTITTAATSTNICSTMSVAILGGGASTYTWQPGGATTTSIVVTPTASTTYTLTGNQGGCTGTKTIAINVNPTPTISAVNNNGPLCDGVNLNLSSTATPAAVAGGTVAYSWTGPGSFSSNLQNPVLANAQFTNSGTYSLTVTNTFTNGATCVSTATTTNANVVQTNSINLSPLTSTLCQGATFSLNASAVAASSYSWSGPSFTTVTQNPVLTNVMPTNSGNYSVTAFFTSSTTTLVCSKTAVSNFSVVGTNTVSASATPNVCQHATATLVANATGAVGYNWIGPNNFTSTSGSNTISAIQPPSGGVYSVTAVFAIGSVSCSTSGATQINVVPVNSITVSAPVSVCYPSNVSLQSSAIGALGYQWTGPNNYTANINNITMVNPGTNASGIYTVTSSFNNGLLTCYNTNTVQVTVNPILTFTLPTYKQICYNQPYIVNGPAGATSYSWVSSNGYTSNTQNLNIPSILPTQAGTYSLNAYLGPCVTTRSTQVDVLSPIQFTLTPFSRSICNGDSVKFVMGSAGGSQNYAYVWNPAVFIGSPTGNTAVGVPLGTTIYNVTGYDIACPNYSITHTFTVDVKQPPKPNLQLDKQSGCEPLCLFLNSNTQQDAAITTYDFGGDLKFQGDSVMYCLNNPGIYNLKIYSKGTNGCSGTYVHQTPITVFPKPHSEITYNPENPSSTNSQVTFIPSHQYGPVVSTEWMFQGASNAPSYDTSSLRNPVRNYDNVGRYPVSLISTTDKGCVDTVFKMLEIKDEMTVYIPNSFTPNGDNLNDIFNVKGIGLKAEGYSMEIFDRWGTLIYSTKDILKGWDGLVKGQQASDGVYIYKVKVIGANGEGRKEYIGHVTLLK